MVLLFFKFLKDFKVVGIFVVWVDIFEKVDGIVKFGIDV